MKKTSILLLVVTLFCSAPAVAQDKVIQKPTKKTQTTPAPKSNSSTTSGKSNNKSTSTNSSTQSTTSSSSSSQQTRLNNGNSQSQSSNSIGYSNGHGYVDLGLSVKWATCNVGASSPSDYGNYYAWGETRIKSSYTEENSVTYGKNIGIGNIAGIVSFDAASTCWGNTWRLPTKENVDELIKNCKWTWTTQDGHRGYKITGPNGNSIFLPAAGNHNGKSLISASEGGGYWTATTFRDNNNYAYGLSFGNNHFDGGWDNRFRGQSVRPVLDTTRSTTQSSMSNQSQTKNTSSSQQTKTSSNSSKQSQVSNSNVQTLISEPTGYINGYGYVDLGLSVKWATCNVGASYPSFDGNYYAWGETKTKSEYTKKNSVNYNKKMKRSIVGNPTYDVARANWGGTWRLPTKAEIDELINKCKRQWTTISGKKGYKITGPNGNSIFLPAAGNRNGISRNNIEDGKYWSATPLESDTKGAHYLSFGSGDFYNSGIYRYYGLLVRPVSE